MLTKINENGLLSAIVNSRAEETFINPTFIPIKIEKLKTPEIFTFDNWEKSKIKEFSNVTLSFPEENFHITYKIKFLVSEELPVPIVIWNNFLKEHDTKVDYKKENVKIKDIETPFMNKVNSRFKNNYSTVNGKEINKINKENFEEKVNTLISDLLNKIR